MKDFSVSVQYLMIFRLQRSRMNSTHFPYSRILQILRSKFGDHSTTKSNINRWYSYFTESLSIDWIQSLSWECSAKWTRIRIWFDVCSSPFASMNVWVIMSTLELNMNTYDAVCREIIIVSSDCRCFLYLQTEFELRKAVWIDQNIINIEDRGSMVDINNFKE